MKNTRYLYSKIAFFIGVFLLAFVSCEREPSQDATFAVGDTTADIFTDTPIGMGSNFYFPYGPDASNALGSKPTAWSVDNKTAYKGSASMRFDVPNADDPLGNFAGALFKIDGVGRDLTGYNVLTFWAKASQGCNIAEIGFGEGNFATKIENVSMGTQWTKYYIPIPDASKFISERGMLFYSAGSINGFGYTFWIDELRFEKLGTLGNAMPFIKNGLDQSSAVFIGDTSLKIDGVGANYSLPNGTVQKVAINPMFFNFTTTNSAVATTNASTISIVGPGTAVLKGSLRGIEAAGSLTVKSSPLAPIPTLPQNRVISIFSDTYTNNPVEFYNGYYAPFQTTLGQDDININGNKLIKYTNLNFVGIEFQGTPVNISTMNRFHIDILIDEPLQPGDFFDIRLDNLSGNVGTYRLNSSSAIPITTPGWISLDLPFSAFPGLNPNTTNLKQIIFITDGTIKTVFIDNIYFHN